MPLTGATVSEVEAAPAADGGVQEELPALCQLEGEHAVPDPVEALPEAVAQADEGQHGDQGLRTHRRRTSLPAPLGQIFLQSPPAVRNPSPVDGVDVGAAHGKGEAAAGT